MRNILEKAQSQIVLFDGGIGTMLLQAGLPTGESPERWNLENPEAVVNIHRQYVLAGADVVTSNSFGGHPYKLKLAGLDAQAFEINRSAAAIARQAVKQDAFVAGSIGPTGVILMMGDIDPQELRDGFELQARALVAGGIDIFIIESMSDLEEVTLAFQAIKRVSALPIIISMTYEAGKTGYRTMMGADIATAARKIQELGADIIATNCGAGIEPITEIVATLRPLTSLPILAEPNAGLPKLVDGKTVYLETPETMAQKLPALIQAGASLVGGCCGTTPAHIHSFRKVLENLSTA